MSSTTTACVLPWVQCGIKSICQHVCRTYSSCSVAFLQEREPCVEVGKQKRGQIRTRGEVAHGVLFPFKTAFWNYSCTTYLMFWLLAVNPDIFTHVASSKWWWEGFFALFFCLWLPVSLCFPTFLCGECLGNREPVWNSALCQQRRSTVAGCTGRRRYKGGKGLVKGNCWVFEPD